MGYGAASLEAFAVGLELGGSVPGFWTGHAAETDHLHPARVPREGVREEAAREREVETDDGVAFVEVRMSRGEEGERA